MGWGVGVAFSYSKWKQGKWIDNKQVGGGWMDITFIHRLLPPLPSGAAGNAFLFIKQEQGTCTVQLVQTYLILNLNKNKQSRKKNPF